MNLKKKLIWSIMAVGILAITVSAITYIWAELSPVLGGSGFIPSYYSTSNQGSGVAFAGTSFLSAWTPYGNNQGNIGAKVWANSPFRRVHSNAFNVTFTFEANISGNGIYMIGLEKYGVQPSDIQPAELTARLSSSGTYGTMSIISNNATYSCSGSNVDAYEKELVGDYVFNTVRFEHNSPSDQVRVYFKRDGQTSETLLGTCNRVNNNTYLIPYVTVWQDCTGLSAYCQEDYIDIRGIDAYSADTVLSPVPNPQPTCTQKFNVKREDGTAVNMALVKATATQCLSDCGGWFPIYARNELTEYSNYLGEVEFQDTICEYFENVKASKVEEGYEERIYYSQVFPSSVPVSIYLTKPVDVSHNYNISVNVLNFGSLPLENNNVITIRECGDNIAYCRDGFDTFSIDTYCPAKVEKFSQLDGQDFFADVTLFGDSVCVTSEYWDSSNPIKKGLFQALGGNKNLVFNFYYDTISQQQTTWVGFFDDMYSNYTVPPVLANVSYTITSDKQYRQTGYSNNGLINITGENILSNLFTITAFGDIYLESRTQPFYFTYDGQEKYVPMTRKPSNVTPDKLFNITGIVDSADGGVSAIIQPTCKYSAVPLKVNTNSTGGYLIQNIIYDDVCSFKVQPVNTAKYYNDFRADTFITGNTVIDFYLGTRSGGENGTTRSVTFYVFYSDIYGTQTPIRYANVKLTNDDSFPTLNGQTNSDGIVTIENLQKNIVYTYLVTHADYAPSNPTSLPIDKGYEEVELQPTVTLACKLKGNIKLVNGTSSINLGNQRVNIKQGEAVIYSILTDGSGNYEQVVKCDTGYNIQTTCPDGTSATQAVQTQGEGSTVETPFVCTVQVTNATANQIVDFIYALVPMLLLLFLLFVIMIFVGVLDKITGW